MKPEYKKASVEDKIKAAPALLKGYQEEVDNLTKRAKFGENAFLNGKFVSLFIW
jgi:homeobox protein cut-like